MQLEYTAVGIERVNGKQQRKNGEKIEHAVALHLTHRIITRRKSEYVAADIICKESRFMLVSTR